MNESNEVPEMPEMPKINSRVIQKIILSMILVFFTAVGMSYSITYLLGIAFYYSYAGYTLIAMVVTSGLQKL